LAEPDYNLAIKAYQERIPVICSGDLSKEGEAFVLKNPEALRYSQRSRRSHSEAIVSTGYPVA
jgi:hypothetical protein